MSRSRMARKRAFHLKHPQGTCFTPSGPGQNYEVEAYIEGERDPVTGMIVDIADLDRMLKLAVEPLSQTSWGDQPLPATTATLSERIFSSLKPFLKAGDLQLVKVRVYQDEDLWVDRWA